MNNAQSISKPFLDLILCLALGYSQNPKSHLNPRCMKIVWVVLLSLSRQNWVDINLKNNNQKSRNTHALPLRKQDYVLQPVEVSVSPKEEKPTLCTLKL